MFRSDSARERLVFYLCKMDHWSWIMHTALHPSQKLLQTCRLRNSSTNSQVAFCNNIRQPHGRIAASADDDAPPEVSGDWRAFRAGLISKSGNLLESTDLIPLQSASINWGASKGKTIYDWEKPADCRHFSCKTLPTLAATLCATRSLLRLWCSAQKKDRRGLH